MASPLIEALAVVKDYGGAAPLRLAQLVLESSEHLVVSGLDAAAAETLMHLVTGAALPDAGEIRIEGRPTREIATDTEWLEALDRFGMVTHRAVLFESLPTSASLALPFSVAVDPMTERIRAQVVGLASAVGLAADLLDTPVAELSPAERVRVHLARALAHDPRMVLLEHPTATIDVPRERQAFGRMLRGLSDARGFGWLAVSDDLEFARTSGGRHVALIGATGALEAPARRRWLWKKRQP